MTTREPILSDVIGIIVGAGLVLGAVTRRGNNIQYPAGDIRATPEFNLIVTALLVGFGAFFVVVFTIRLIWGVRERRQ